MTQSEFEAALAEEFGWTKVETQGVLDTIADEVYKGLKVDGVVVVRGLGRFKINDLKARMGRNPQTGESIKIKASRKLKVLPNKGMKDRLRVK